MRARKKLKGVELKMLSLKIRKDAWFAWKMQAAIEETTMSELVERLVLKYVAREGGVDPAYAQRSRRKVKGKRKDARKARSSVRSHGRKNSLSR